MKQIVIVFSSYSVYDGGLHHEVTDLLQAGYHVIQLKSEFHPSSEEYPEPVYLHFVTLEKDEAA